MYKIHKIDGDGNCLFYAIAYGILYKYNLNINEYKKLGVKLRKRACDYLKGQITRKNYDIIYAMGSDFNTLQSSSPIENAKKYLSKMYKNGTWGGQLEILALSDYIHSKGFRGILVYDEKCKRIKHMRSNIGSCGPYIKIMLHGVSYGGIHFDFISTT